jgi:hypothetical protein
MEANYVLRDLRHEFPNHTFDFVETTPDPNSFYPRNVLVIDGKQTRIFYNLDVEVKKVFGMDPDAELAAILREEVRGELLLQALRKNFPAHTVTFQHEFSYESGPRKVIVLDGVKTHAGVDHDFVVALYGVAGLDREAELAAIMTTQVQAYLQKKGDDEC